MGGIDEELGDSVLNVDTYPSTTSPNTGTPLSLNDAQSRFGGVHPCVDPRDAKKEQASVWKAPALK